MTNPKATPDSLKDLPQFQFHLLARLYERLAEAEMQRGFGVRLFEARIICMVGSLDPCPFKILTTDGQFEKGYASRAVTDLAGRGLMVSRPDELDRRASVLRLTPAGKRLFRKLMTEALHSNDRWLASLPEDERAGLVRALASLFRMSISASTQKPGA